MLDKAIVDIERKLKELTKNFNKFSSKLTEKNNKIEPDDRDKENMNRKVIKQDHYETIRDRVAKLEKIVAEITGFASKIPQIQVIK